MSRKLAIDVGHHVPPSIGRPPIRAPLLVQQFLSALSDCFAPLRGLIAELVAILPVFRGRSTTRAVIMIPIQARGERRAQRFNS